jgi:hypothetical protein
VFSGLARDRRINVALGESLFRSHGDDGRGGFDVEVEVSRTVTKEPNTAKITVYNPSEEEAVAFYRAATGRNQLVRVWAGWRTTGLVQVIQGNPVKDGVVLRYKGAERVLEVSIQDGLRTYRSGRVNVRLPAGSRLSDVIRSVADAAGLGVEAIFDEDSDVVLDSAYTATGPIKDVLSGLASATGADWSIQDGALQVLGRRAVLGGTSPLFSSRAGTLIGAPQIKGRDGAEFEVMFAPDVRPGTRFAVDHDGRLGEGVWKAVEVKHKLTLDGEFASKIKARKSA